MDDTANESLVSIVMPTSNSARTVDRAVDSLFAQSHANWQLICVDDASKDDTTARLSERARGLGDRFIICRLPRNGGPAHARNQALALCRGSWVAVLDADDAWQADRLKYLLEAAHRDSAEGVCDNIMAFHDHMGQQTKPIFAKLPPTLDIATVVAAEFQGRYNLGYLKPMVRRDFLREHAISYNESLRTGEDLFFLLQILASGGSVVCVDAALYIYTTPVGDTSRKLSRSTVTFPRDNDLASALRSFVALEGIKLDVNEQTAVVQRIAYLDQIASVSAFRHALLRGDWNSALWLFLQQAEVRRWLVGVLRRNRTAKS